MNLATVGVSLGLVVLLYVVYRCLPLFYDYRFSPKGIEVVIGRVLPVFWIRRDKIEMIEVRKRTNLFIDLDQPFAVALGNRITPRFVAVTTKFFPHHWHLTPTDPEEAVRSLGFPGGGRIGG
jgi:hypothetical protein